MIKEESNKKHLGVLLGELRNNYIDDVITKNELRDKLTRNKNLIDNTIKELSDPIANEIFIEKYNELMDELYDDYIQSSTTIVTGREIKLRENKPVISDALKKVIKAYNFALAKHQYGEEEPTDQSKESIKNREPSNGWITKIKEWGKYIIQIFVTLISSIL